MSVIMHASDRLALAQYLSNARRSLEQARDTLRTTDPLYSCFLSQVHFLLLGVIEVHRNLPFAEKKTIDKLDRIYFDLSQEGHLEALHTFASSFPKSEA